MRVTVASDVLGTLSSAEAGRVIASGWPAAQVRVLPGGAAGRGFLRAFGDLVDAEVVTTVGERVVVTTVRSSGEAALHVESTEPRAPGVPLAASSAAVGVALAELLVERPGRVHVDLAGLAVFDGGAGMLAALGARADVPLDDGVAGLTGLTRLDLEPARTLLGGTELVGVVPAAELAAPLLGLRGITSLHGRASGLDPEALLRTDADLGRLAGLALGQRVDLPGAGACGGTGLAVLALGGRLSSGPDVSWATMPSGPVADLVVTGCSVFDFATRGGEVVGAAAARAGAALAPCVVVAGQVLIGGREMRTLGIEAGYPVRDSAADVPAGGDVEPDELAALVRRVGRSWTW